MSGGGGGGGDWRPDPVPPRKPAGGNDPGSGGGGDNPRRPPDPCDLVETTTLNSVDRGALASIRVGDALSVVFLAGPPHRLVAQNAAGNIVGSITSPGMPQYISCITQAGRRYVAKVLSIRGAICQVEVGPA